MRPSPNPLIEPFRSEHPTLGAGVVGEPTGFFQCKSLSVKGDTLRIIASVGFGWEHVSISLPDRCPVWEEMVYVKDLFWSDSETVVQFHPPRNFYINYHPHCLHLWKPTGRNIDTPPTHLIAPSYVDPSRI